MTFRVLFSILFTLATCRGEDAPRFSSGPIHSGEVEFALEVGDAKHLRVAIEGDPAQVEWQQLFLEDDKEKRLELTAKLMEKPFKIDAIRFTKLVGKLRVTASGDQNVQVHIHHDAPRTAAGSLKVDLKGSASRGRNMFARGTCTSCHALAGRGAKVGPDLAKLGKQVTTEKLIESLVAPDASLAKGFETTIVTTKDGTPHLGFVIADSEKTITIKDSGGQLHEINKRLVVSRKPQAFSLMPAFGELMTAQQIADLAAFLKAIQH
ncbi:MAG: putative heme-binding domain-containing protein [Verrucomicrobiales bacterium]|jgi:putative heme-binding domain-containing protein